VRSTWAACRTPSRFMPSIRNGRHRIAGTSVAPNARDAETGRRLGLPDFPNEHFPDPLFRWILKDPGLVRGGVPGCAQQWLEKSDKKLMPQSHSSWPNRRSPASEIAKSNDSGHPVSVLAGRRSDSCGPPLTEFGQFSFFGLQPGAATESPISAAWPVPSPELSTWVECGRFIHVTVRFTHSTLDSIRHHSATPHA
jgi:hypothetical protein